MTPNLSHVAGLELASEAVKDYTSPEAIQGAIYWLLNQAKSAPAKPVSREAVAKVSVWQIDPWYAREPSQAGRNIGVVFLGDHAKILVDGQLLYTAIA